ncbi:MAG: glycosyltransferase family 2 protein [Jatrophihabitans sp.]|uniref:glycosyltransferase family 2 protein n=1 Tax=Jatrophihabitans sp. TaxID=1932789 RepID=UPI003F7D49CF
MIRFGIAEVDFGGDEPVVRRPDDLAPPLRLLVISRVGGVVTGTAYTDAFDHAPTDDDIAAAAARPTTPVVSRPQAGRPAATPVVVICTRDNADELQRLLASLAVQTVAEFEVVVVDNAPGRGATEQVVTGAAMPPGVRVRYVPEPRPGLSIARNTGLGAVDDERAVVAWLDDDETAEPGWLAGLLAAFAEVPQAWAVSGTVLPAELETPAQQLFELYGGHSKGRGFAREVFDRTTVDPLLPLPPFGVGANFAAPAWVYRRVGRFDECLGAGTVTRGGEDTLFFTEVLLAGGSIVYEPTAVTRHRHRRELHELEAQFVGYGRGLTAFYTALLVRHPRLVWRLLRSAPAALRALRGSAAMGRADMGLELPRSVVRGKYFGYLAGAPVYLRLRLTARGGHRAR